MDCKFPEPRGWALKWEGTALLPPADCLSWRDDALDAASSSAAWVPQWRQIAAATMPGSSNGKGKNRLTWPRGWALQWEGSALTGSAYGHELAKAQLTEPRKEGAA